MKLQLMTMFFFFCSAALFKGQITKPNIIIILSDDHGYTDLGIRGIDPNVRTPFIDNLCANGALMINGYCTAPQCVPSRAGLLSGRVQNTFGLRGNGESDEPIPYDVPTIAERLKYLGYQTGFVGKWHLGESDNAPKNRGFDDYVLGPLVNHEANYDLNGNAIAPKVFKITENRVQYQGKAAAAFIDKNHAKPFFLYFAPFGPHLPRIEKTDPYYLNFPAVSYPNLSLELNEVRRQGLGLVHAVDDAVGRVIAQLKKYGIEENTIIFFAGDNGAQPKYFDEIYGRETVEKWNGSDNIPLRGEKGSVWEGGIKVPMFVYWKGKISSGQIINTSISTLDFTATALKLAGGEVPEIFDGVDILPLLTKKENNFERSKELFWDWGDGIALQKDDWKIHRSGEKSYLFNIKDDPNEFFDIKKVYPHKFNEMEVLLMDRYNALPLEGQSKLNKNTSLYEKGAPLNVPTDFRYVYPYSSTKTLAYPRKLESPDKSTIISNYTFPPTISSIEEQKINQSTSTGALSFIVDDAETPSDQLIVTGFSSDITKLRNTDIVIKGSGSKRTVTITPSQTATGNVVVTLSVNDAQGKSSKINFNVFIWEVKSEANVLPEVRITAPIDGSSIPQLSDLTVRATASDADGTISKVNLFLNDLQLPSLTSPLIWNRMKDIPALSSMREGKYTLKVVAIDNVGGERTTTVDFEVISRITLLDKENMEKESPITISPNPSHGGIFFLSQATEWKVLTLQGQEIISGRGNQINLSGYPKGGYMVHFGQRIEFILVE